MQWSNLTTPLELNIMKLFKFIAAAFLISSTSLVSGGNAASTGVNQAAVAYCPNWPYCRDVEITEQNEKAQSKDLQQYLAYCPNWPYCRDVEVTEQIVDLRLQMQTQLVRKAA